MLRSLLLSRGGAQEDHMACIAGNVTPWGGEKDISAEIQDSFVDIWNSVESFVVREISG